MAEPKDMILPLLREIRAEMNTRFDAMHRAINGESVLGRYATAEVEERLADLEGPR